jgi:hypothetical protein
MTRSKHYPDARGFAAVAAAARDRSGWSAGERAALRGIAARDMAPLIRTRRPEPGGAGVVFSIFSPPTSFSVVPPRVDSPRGS